MTQSGGDRVEDKTTTKTSAASEKPTEKRSITDRKLPQFEEPGLRNVRTTNIFRAVNFELYVKPNLFVMTVGVLTLSLCVGYVAYMNATSENKKNTYTVMNEDGSFHRRQRTSRWD